MPRFLPGLISTKLHKCPGSGGMCVSPPPPLGLLPPSFIPQILEHLPWAVLGTGDTAGISYRILQSPGPDENTDSLKLLLLRDFSVVQ